MKSLRVTARVMSIILIGFCLFMFIGESFESNAKTGSNPLALNAILQLSVFAIGLFGLAIAWKWEIAGGLLSILAFIVLFIINPNALVPIMLIFPTNAILFLILGYQKNEMNKATQIK